MSNKVKGSVLQSTGVTVENLGDGVTLLTPGADVVTVSAKSLKAGANVSLTEVAGSIVIGATGGGGGGGSGEANTSSNLGTGVGLAAAKSGVNLPFKSLKAGANVTLSATADEVTISAAGGGGGGSSVFADISAYGAVGDFVPAAGGLGAGTANDSAIMAAIATNKPLYIPDGNFYVANWATRLAFSRATVLQSSVGHVWGDTGRGKQILGNTVNVGATNTHEVSYGGGIRWSPGLDAAGIRIWTGHHNWMVANSENGGMQFQLYPGYGGKGFQGITASCEAPNKLNATGGFTFDTANLRVGCHVGWNGVVYKIASVVSSAQITVTTFAGASPAFVTNTTSRPFYFSYECAMLKANVSGTTLTRVTGDALPYGYAGDHMYAIINGTKYDVSQGPESTGNPSTLTLTSSAGTLTNATVEFYRGYGPWAYVTLFRLQGLGGGVETNGGMAFTIKNELRIWNGGTAAELEGPIKINAPKTAIGPGNGADTSGERLEVEADGVWLGTSSANVSSINGFKVLSAGTGYTPVIAARGIDSDRGMGFDIQGTGKYGFTSGLFANINFEIYANGTSNSWVSVDGGTNIAYIDARSAATNADLKLTPKGTTGKLRLKGIPCCLLRRSGTTLRIDSTASPRAQWTMYWDVELYDAYGMHSSGAKEIFAPIAGIYSISASVDLLFYGAFSLGQNRVQLRIYKNGAYYKGGAYMTTDYTSGYSSGATISCDVLLAAGDYVELSVVQFSNSSGDGHADYYSTTPENTFFDMRLITEV